MRLVTQIFTYNPFIRINSLKQKNSQIINSQNLEKGKTKGKKLDKSLKVTLMTEGEEIVLPQTFARLY